MAEKYYSVSPYAFCCGNPVNFVDPDGEAIVGVTRNDASKIVEDIKQIFKGEEFNEFRKLIVQSGKNANGKRVASISSEDMFSAFNGVNLSDDQQALVSIIVNTINSDDEHFVEYVTDKGVISSKGQSAFTEEFEKAGLPMSTIIEANGGLPVSIISNFGGSGLTVQTPNGSHSVIVGNDHINGREVTAGHEVFGHGRSLAVGRGHSNQHIDAIQTENLILRVMGIPFVNNGSNHGPRTFIPNPTALPKFR
ncbi:MAG: hypothetical protein NC335_04040 [Bacteroides sp.]|nr:hypothetical protein [Bacteroides sp.]